LLKIPLNKPAPLKREKCRKTMSRIVFAVWQYASLPKGLNSYSICRIDDQYFNAAQQSNKIDVAGK